MRASATATAKPKSGTAPCDFPLHTTPAVGPSDPSSGLRCSYAADPFTDRPYGRYRLIRRGVEQKSPRFARTLPIGQPTHWQGRSAWCVPLRPLVDDPPCAEGPLGAKSPTPPCGGVELVPNWKHAPCGGTRREESSGHRSHWMPWRCSRCGAPRIGPARSSNTRSIRRSGVDGHEAISPKRKVTARAGYVKSRSSTSMPWGMASSAVSTMLATG